MTPTPRPVTPVSVLDPSLLFEKRLLHVVEQGVRVKPPGPWLRLEPPTGAERATASAFLRLAAEPTIAAMVARVRRIDEETRDRRDERSAQPIWSALVDLLEGIPLDSQGRPATTFYALALWSSFQDNPMHTAFGALASKRPAAPITKHGLAELARLLLRAQARRWAEADAQRQALRQTDDKTDRAESPR